MVSIALLAKWAKSETQSLRQLGGSPHHARNRRGLLGVPGQVPPRKPPLLLVVMLLACSGGPAAPGRPDGGSSQSAACLSEDLGLLPGVTHQAPLPGWISDEAFPLPGGGPHPVRLFDPCAGTDTGDPGVCADTIDYVDQAGQTRRLPYRITAPRDVSPESGRLPVLLFQHGGGPNPKGQRAYRNLVRFVASQGFIVVQTAVMPACGNSSGCAGSPSIRAAYCAVFGQTPGPDCDQMSIMYFNRPNDFRATLDALPRILRTVDGLAGTLSLRLADLADVQTVAVAGHSAGTNGVLSLAGGGFDYVATAAGTDVDQRDLFPAAFLAFGPNATTSNNGRGWDAMGFSRIAPSVPFLFLTGSRDYAVDVSACERPQAYFYAGSGGKLLHYELGATHASVPLNDEDNASVDLIAAGHTPDHCAPLTSPVRGGDDFGPASPETTTPLELAIYSGTEGILLPFLRAALLGDAAAAASLAAAPEDTGSLSTFDFASTHLERRGSAGPSIKVLSPRAVQVGGGCGTSVPLRLLRRGSDAAVTLVTTGLPPPALATAAPIAAGSTMSSLVIDRAGAPAGTYVVRVTGQADGVPVLGTELRVQLE